MRLRQGSNVPASSALWHFESGTTADVGGYSFTGKYNSPARSTAQAKFGTYSWLGDSSSQGANAQSGNISLGGGTLIPGAMLNTIDSTVDFWIRPISQTSHTLFSFGTGTTVYYAIRIEGGVLVMRNNSTVYITGTTAIVDGAWQHVAMTHVAGTNTTYLFLDGNLEGSYTGALSGYSSQSFYFGGKPSEGFNNGPSMFRGYMDELRLILGTAAWTASFTPATAAYTS